MKQNTFDDKKDSMLKKHRKNTFWKKAVALLSCVTVFFTSYTMILPAMTMSETTYCGQEEGENHTHTLQCYSNPNADLETEANWTATIPSLTGNWNEDAVAVADSQLGYHESEANYHVSDNNEKKGYTRYGAWMNDPYADWNTDFVLFCLHYANVDANALSLSNDISTWTSNGAFVSKDSYAPNAGDLIVLDENNDGAADHAAIITEANGNAIRIVEGDLSDAVTQVNYDTTDARVIGYIRMPQNPAMQTVAETAEETSAPEATAAPEETSQPEGTTVPETEQVAAAETATPEATAEPQETPEPEVTATPEATATAEAKKTIKKLAGKASLIMSRKTTEPRVAAAPRVANVSQENTIDLHIEKIDFSNKPSDANSWADLSSKSGTVAVNDQTFFRAYYSFHIPKGTLTASNHTLVYNMPDIILNKFKNRKCVSISNLTVVDSKGDVIGHYSISEEGHITIDFNEKAIEKNQNSDADGTLNYQFGLADIITTYDQKVDIPYSDQLTIPDVVYRNPADMKVTKSNNFYDSNREKGTITYTIRVSSINGTYDNVTLRDNLSEGQSKDFDINHLIKSTIKVENGSTPLKEASTVSSSTYVIESATYKDFTIILPKMNPNTDYVITYTTSYANDVNTELLLPDSYPLNNVAKAETKNENNEEFSREFNNQIWLNSASIQKSGKYDETSKTVQWTITVNNPEGIDLHGIRLSDNYQGNSLSSNQIVDDNVKLKINDKESLISKEQFLNYTFLIGSTSSKYEFIYRTKVDDSDAGKYISNQASIHTPDEKQSKDSGATGISIPGNTPATPDSQIKKEGRGAVSAGNVVINNWHLDFKLPDPDGSGQCEFYDDLWNYQYFTQSQIQDIYNKITQQYSGEFILRAYPYVYENGIMTDRASDNGIIWPFESQEKFKKISIIFKNISQNSGTEIAFAYQSSADPERLPKDDETTFTNGVSVSGHYTSASNKYYPDFPTIEKMDGNNNSQSSTSYEYSQLQNHMLKWLIRCHLRNYSGGDLTVTDTIPEDLIASEAKITFLLKDNPWTQGSATVDLTKKVSTAVLRDTNGNCVGDAYNLETRVDRKKITIVFPQALIQYINQNVSLNQRCNKYIDISVSCKIPDNKDWSKIYKDGTYQGVQKYLNKAEMIYGNNRKAEASQEMTVIKDESDKVLSKVFDGIDRGDDDIDNILKYTVHINPNMDKLIADESDHSTLTFHDQFKSKYSLDTNGAVSFRLIDVEIKKISGNGDVSKITRKVNGTTNAVNDNNKQREFIGDLTLENVPDQTAIDVTYSYKVVVQKVAPLLSASNTAELIGGTRKAESSKETGQLEMKKSSASVTFHGLTFVKVSSENHDIKLPNAEFQLSKFDPSITGTADKDKFVIDASLDHPDGKYLTGKDGSITIKDLIPNTYYRLVETKAPFGYQLNQTPFYFYIQDGDLEKYPLEKITLPDSEIHILNGGDEQQIQNTPVHKVIHLKKVDAQNSEKGLAGAEFGLYKDSGCLNAVEGLDALISSDDSGVLKDANGNGSFDLTGGTYYLKEKKAPSGYQKMQQILVVQVTENGVSVLQQSGKATDQAEVSGQTIMIKNSMTQYELPDTGGTGTAMIYVAGGVLVAVAVVMLVMQKRKKS